jgi:hypothetical protein
MMTRLFNYMSIRQLSSAPVPVLGTVQVLVIEVYLLFQPKSNSDATMLKRAFWLKLFKQLFAKMPFVAGANAISIKSPIDKATSVMAGVNLEPQNGVVLRYSVAIRDPKEHFRYYQDGKLLISALELQKALQESSIELPFGGELKLVLVTSHFKSAKVVIQKDQSDSDSD